MATTVFIPTPLRPFTGEQATVQVAGSNVGEILTNLVTVHPELRNHLYTAEGKLRSFVNVYVNDEDIRYLQKEATVVGDSDSVSIVPSVAGQAWVTGHNTITLDDRDPFVKGFSVL